MNLIDTSSKHRAAGRGATYSLICAADPGHAVAHLAVHIDGSRVFAGAPFQLEPVLGQPIARRLDPELAGGFGSCDDRCRTALASLGFFAPSDRSSASGAKPSGLDVSAGKQASAVPSVWLGRVHVPPGVS